jgi:hypothetical protein
MTHGIYLILQLEGHDLEEGKFFPFNGKGKALVVAFI